jgi:hypothetical protein
MPKTCPASAASGSDSSRVLAPARAEAGVVHGGQRRVEGGRGPHRPRRRAGLRGSEGVGVLVGCQEQIVDPRKVDDAADGW